RARARRVRPHPGGRPPRWPAPARGSVARRDPAVRVRLLPLPSPVINVAVFSKNRGCQLELFLRSAPQFFAGSDQLPVSVLHAYDDDSYAAGYRLAASLHPEVTFVREGATGGTFKKELLSLVSLTRTLTVFFVDDDVFRAPFGLDAPEVQRLRADHSLLC